MNVKPYIPRSERSKIYWQEVADLLEVHPLIAREFYWEEYFRVMTTIDFLSFIKKGEIKKEDEILLEFKNTWTLDKINEKQIRADELAKEGDFSDLISYRLKCLIEIGDETLFDETKTYTFSEKEYITKGKKYTITSLSDDREPLSGFSCQTTTNLKKERNWTSNHGIKVLWRDGIEIWNWHLEYLKLFIEQNPNHANTQEMIDYCTVGAEKTRQGI